MQIKIFQIFNNKFKLALSQLGSKKECLIEKKI
jgi:hypothetical protein